MKKTFIFIMLICAASLSDAFAQVRFDVKKASKTFDAKVEVERCNDDGNCDGRLQVELFKKAARQPFQIIKLQQTEFTVEEARTVNSKMLYDYQSAIFFEDYNFDGREDLAIRDGNESGYGGPSYQVYLYAPRTGKFVKSPRLTAMAHDEGLGMFEVDKKRKVLVVYSKSGCCFHQRDEFRMINDRPVKVFEEIEDARLFGDENDPSTKRVTITTSRLIKGRWITRVRHEPRRE